ncbi:membrane protease subunit (stomatin/prohibitin family) [Dysgonomonas sp. PFB1-18]|uniref:SPFH domain-containing protein n=1 Tax=unclassified Dysgonomonas TaxID=2630389 RepID=UPI002476FE63|nr:MULTISPECIES: SPFH domain-containing protein [unclassified Dysgonomonas]MDH6307401.1 membrane protease subunit (stomatin/prohibitin family) [Dysgonomonas sp. PF1-14]MDH6337319.1 membrane protease subunit (stomatin/prohibitin family) [Dysgonomonas sp. PF1-16]MDH6379243.1 membrane protease subunit (stomatin/prohibitin family) [Dysgonomonas sp. PFB1-18]MDH6396119.1 membrane protease subunit (stomatin/prohibitin family) [Dysgonomonas sp. PF1-23]
MAIFNVIKYQGSDKEFAWRYPYDNLNIGSQLVVNTSQTAFFVRGGVIYDQFAPGTYTLKTNNIPLLNKVINIPFGGETPFKAEVWFINLINKLDCKWGTLNPIQLEDPKYGVIVPVRAYGQYGIKICRPKIFLETLVGNMDSYSSDKILEYFKGKVLSSLTSLVSQKLVSENISILEINAHLDSMSAFCQEKLSIEFKKYGIDVVNFFFMSINASEDDSSVKKLKEAKDFAARIKIIGRDNYQMDKSFDVLGKAAENEGMSSNFIGAGIGMGVGMGVGNQIGNMSNQMVNTNPQIQTQQQTQSQAPQMPPPPPLSTVQYFLYINNVQTGPYSISDMQSMILDKQVDRNVYVWKQGMQGWDIANNVPELNQILNTLPPPFPTNNP